MPTTWAATIAADRPTLVDAILIYNNFPDSEFRVLLQMDATDLPPKVIGLPTWLLDIPLTQSEAGALVAAIGVYVTPDTRWKPRMPLDREARFDRIMLALNSCPAALSSLIRRLEDSGRDGDLTAILREVRTKRVEYAVSQRQHCPADD